MIAESSFVKVGEHFGVSDNSIKKWCKSYNIPTKRRALVEWYNSQVESDKKIISIYAGSKRVSQIDVQTGNVIAIFGSLADAARTMGANGDSNIFDACNGRKKTAYGYVWRYVDEPNS